MCSENLRQSKKNKFKKKHSQYCCRNSSLLYLCTDQCTNLIVLFSSLPLSNKPTSSLKIKQNQLKDGLVRLLVSPRRNFQQENYVYCQWTFFLKKSQFSCWWRHNAKKKKIQICADITNHPLCNKPDCFLTNVTNSLQIDTCFIFLTMWNLAIVFHNCQLDMKKGNTEEIWFIVDYIHGHICNNTAALQVLYSITYCLLYSATFWLISY